VGGGHVFGEVMGRRVVAAGGQVFFGCRALVAASRVGLFGSCRAFFVALGCVVVAGRVAARSGVLLMRSGVARRRRPRGSSQQ